MTFAIPTWIYLIAISGFGSVDYSFAGRLLPPHAGMGGGFGGGGGVVRERVIDLPADIVTSFDLWWTAPWHGGNRIIEKGGAMRDLRWHLATLKE